MIRARKRAKLETAEVRILIASNDDAATVQMLSQEISAAIDRVRKATAKTPPPPSGCRGCGDA